MNIETISENEKYLVSFETKFIIQANNYEEAVEKMKSEIIKKMDDNEASDSTLSIHLIASTSIEDQELSYIDDWEYDDRW
ncbi:MAG: hypothetical protein HeimC2_11790 [Candidatus Heimdallarchaeota archaeon LC_2]|nr:MAG: hypothetical protein HeimC2_11790 [Candidatus Heimdallarchaeota archaeon LC_2]